MRWPWSRRRRLLLVEELDLPDDDDDPAEPGAALERARRAVEKAETNGNTMHGLARSIHRERQRNNFAPSIYRSMLRKET